MGQSPLPSPRVHQYRHSVGDTVRSDTEQRSGWGTVAEVLAWLLLGIEVLLLLATTYFRLIVASFDVDGTVHEAEHQTDGLRTGSLVLTILLVGALAGIGVICAWRAWRGRRPCWAVSAPLVAGVIAVIGGWLLLQAPLAGCNGTGAHHTAEDILPSWSLSMCPAGTGVHAAVDGFVRYSSTCLLVVIAAGVILLVEAIVFAVRCRLSPG